MKNLLEKKRKRKMEKRKGDREEMTGKFVEGEFSRSRSQFCRQFPPANELDCLGASFACFAVPPV